MIEIQIKRNLPGFNLDVVVCVNQEILAILGPSGSGKTMTLRCIAGLDRPDEGFIKLNDRVLFDSESKINVPARARKIGFVFQNYALFPHLNVCENIAYGINSLEKNSADEKIEQLMQRMHIADLGHRYPHQLSAGQQQRVALARAIAPGPDVLLLDEPFSALDTPRRERLEYELLMLQQYYQGDILFVTHDLAQGYKLGSRIAVFNKGRIVQCGPKNEVIFNPADRSVARLTGVKNMMEGIVVEKMDRQNTRVKVPQLEKPLRVAGGNHVDSQVGQAVTIGIRPEYISIANGQQENIIPCNITQLITGVTDMHVHFNAVTDAEKKYTIEAKLPWSTAPEVSSCEKCYLYLPPEHLMIL